MASTANTSTRPPIVKKVSTLNVPMNSGVTALYRGNRVGSVPLTHTCANMGFAANMQPLGVVAEDRPGVDNLGGTSYPVPINLDETIEVVYLDNDSASLIALETDFMKVAYFKDDHTFTLSTTDGTTAYMKAGRIVDVNSRDGVGVWMQPILSQIASGSFIS